MAFRLLVLTLALAALVPIHVLAAGPRLEVTFIQWIPGIQPLLETTPPFRPGDNAILRPYRMAGTILSTVEVSVDSPTGLDSRMVFFLRPPATPASVSARLPVPDSGIDFVSNEGERCWSYFPANTVHRLEHFVALSMPASDATGAERQMTFEIVGANGDVKRGVAAQWPVTGISNDAIQQARATERAQLRLTVSSTAVARAR